MSNQRRQLKPAQQVNFESEMSEDSYEWARGILLTLAVGFTGMGLVAIVVAAATYYK